MHYYLVILEVVERDDVEKDGAFVFGLLTKFLTMVQYNCVIGNVTIVVSSIIILLNVIF